MSNFETKEALKIEAQLIGKVLEGEGKITSTLEETEFGKFASALEKSVREIEQPNCAACVDGRRCLCQADGSETKLRPRKAGGSVATLAMMGMGDRLINNDLTDNAHDAADIYNLSSQFQHILGNTESGHFDCGAAKGLPKHVRSVSELKLDSRPVKLVKDILDGEIPEGHSDQLVSEVIEQAGPFADILEKCGWNGDEYVQRVAMQKPAAVEKLEVDATDPVGGHAEDAVVVVDGPVDEEARPLHTVDEEELFRLTGRRAFIVNLNEIRRDATQLGSHPPLSERLYAAGLLHLVGGVYKNLGDGSHPLFIVRIA